MSTIAVFLVLGGTAVAVTRISGSQIANRSIPAAKIKRKALTAKEVRSAGTAIRLRNLVVSRSRRPVRRSSAIDLSLEKAANGSGTVQKLQLGQSASLLQSGPFSVEVQCVKNPSDNPKWSGKPSVYTTVSTDVDNTVVNGIMGPQIDGVSGRLDRGETGVLLPKVSGTGPLIGPFDFLMVAPNGEQLLGQMFAGSNGLGADCFASAWAVV